MNTTRAEQLWETSKEVLQDTALPNGAMVAANSDLSVYPASAENYRYVWGRDNAYQIVSGNVLELPMAADMRRKYQNWLWIRAEGFAETGLIIKRYGTNGNLDWRYGTEYQPDQAGALLWALDSTTAEPDDLTDKTMTHLANGLSSQWSGKNFSGPTQDLWENRLTNPEDGDVFTYSLAAVAHGLHSAISRLRGKTGHVNLWEQTLGEMSEVFEADQINDLYLRKIYADDTNDLDTTLDASLDALVYPFDSLTSLHPAKVERTVAAIDENLCEFPDGVKRYDGDTYDGIVRPGGLEDKAGPWPLLTFMHVIALNKTGQSEKARSLYETTIDRLDQLYEDKELPDNLIPEQLFPDTRQGKGILPLAWSHAMFVLATRELDIL